MFQETIRLLAPLLAGRFLLSIITLAVVLIIRIVVAKLITKRGDLVLVAKGYDPEDINLGRLATWITIIFGIILGFLIVFLYANAFPAVNPTTDLDSEAEDDDEGHDNMTREEKAVLSIYRTLKKEDKEQIKKALRFMYNKDN